MYLRQARGGLVDPQNVHEQPLVLSWGSYTVPHLRMPYLVAASLAQSSLYFLIMSLDAGTM